MSSGRRYTSVRVLAGATTGVATVASYTAPDGVTIGPARSAAIRGHTVVLNGGAPTVQAQVWPLGVQANAIQMRPAGTVSYESGTVVTLNPGDKFVIQCTVGVAATSADVLISVEEDF